MIHEIFRTAGEFHGHTCPGLAIGVRAAVEAKRLLDVEEIHGHNLYCIAENRACYIDGIQTVFGTTLGGGNLEICPRGKTAFNFYDRASAKCARCGESCNESFLRVKDGEILCLDCAEKREGEN